MSSFQIQRDDEIDLRPHYSAVDVVGPASRIALAPRRHEVRGARCRMIFLPAARLPKLTAPTRTR